MIHEDTFYRAHTTETNLFKTTYTFQMPLIDAPYTEAVVLVAVAADTRSVTVQPPAFWLQRWELVPQCNQEWQHN